MTPILTITGSDNSGWSGLQLDYKTILELGGHALTSCTCIVMQDQSKIHEIIDLPTSLICNQVRSIVTNFHPKAIKVGWLRNAETVKVVRDEIVGCRNIVLSPGILSSRGEQLVDEDVIEAIKKHLIPEARLLMARCNESEKMLQMKITTSDDMLEAARAFGRMGAQFVLLRGGQMADGRLLALLYSTETDEAELFSSYNIHGWQQHGVGGALSAAIATRLALGNDVPTAIKKAHQYVHSRIVYSVADAERSIRTTELYDQFMTLLAAHYQTAHDVSYYAESLSISQRYLVQVTSKEVNKSPKQVIGEYLMEQAQRLLDNTQSPIKEIANHLGFSSTVQFCRFFKHFQGQSPNEYRLSGNSLT